MFDIEQLTLNAYYLHHEQREEEALVIIDVVLKQDPLYTFALLLKGIIALSLGDYKTGWPLFELLYQRSDAEAYGMLRYKSQPMWDGKPTDKKLLVWANMGLGDMLMMWRYLPMIKALAPNMVLETHQQLFGLALANNLAPRIVRLNQHNEQFDFHWPLMSSPYLFRTELDTIPPTPYLQVEKHKNYRGPRIGIFCQSIPALHMLSDEALVRNLTQEAVDSLCRKHKFISLHQADLKTFDMLETSRYIAALDLVVTTDSAVAHLCGALGVKTFLMLPVKCCWRWLRNRNDSPWYASIRLFRQKTPRDWMPVIEEVVQAIDEEGLDDGTTPAPPETLTAIPYYREAVLPRPVMSTGRGVQWMDLVKPAPLDVLKLYPAEA